MAITIKQFDGSIVTPTDDAIMNQLIMGASGIIEGCVPTWLGSNQIKISAGRGIAMGRQFTVDEETVTVTLTGGSKGRLLIQVDTGNATPGSFVSQAAATLPALEQDDINHGGTIFQVPICTYGVGALAISNMVDVRSLLVGPTVINHSADKITSGTLPLTRGGTGATSASGALSSIGALAKAKVDVTAQAISVTNITDYSIKATIVGGFLLVTCDSAKLTSDLAVNDFRIIITINSGYYMTSPVIDPVVGNGSGVVSGTRRILILPEFSQSSGKILITASESITASYPFNFSIMIPMA